ncbi:MAG: hypothetical protein KBC64_06710 [Simkaniaceae bacterium]|nr:hypothetical protein [Simkaniaceae bacterium]
MKITHNPTPEPIYPTSPIKRFAVMALVPFFLIPLLVKRVGEFALNLLTQEEPLSDADSTPMSPDPLSTREKKQVSFQFPCTVYVFDYNKPGL